MSSRRHNFVILVVDDEPVSLHLASSLLRAAFPQYSVEACGGVGDEREVTELVRRVRPTLVVTDLVMPGVDGLRLIRQLRRSHPEMLVVVMTAHGSEAAAVDALRAGASSYVPKDQLGSDLVDTVKAVLAVRAQHARHEEVFDHMQVIDRSFALPSRSELIAPLVTELQADLRRLDVCPEEDLTRFGVAMTEALMNAMIHGNLGLPSQLLEQGHGVLRSMVEARLGESPWKERRVHVHLRADREEAVCTVRDEGEGFNPGALPDPTEPDMLARPHGRGLLLMRTFMDEVRFNEAGTEVTLVKRRCRR